MIAVDAYPSEPGRRCFLKSVGALSVGFVAGCAIPVIPKRPAPTLKDANGWIGFDGSRYRLVVPRVEKGQNIATALASIACVELSIPAESLDLRLHDTGSIVRVKASVGSDSIKDFALPSAQACATLREAIASGTPPSGRSRAHSMRIRSSRRSTSMHG